MFAIFFFPFTFQFFRAFAVFKAPSLCFVRAPHANISFSFFLYRTMPRLLHNECMQWRLWTRRRWKKNMKKNQKARERLKKYKLTMFYAWANHNKARKCHFPFAKRILWNWNCGILHTIHTHTCSRSYAVGSKSKPSVSVALCCSSHKHHKLFRFVGSWKVWVRIRYPMVT